MNLSKFNERTHIFLTASIAFLIPAYPAIVAPVIALLAINWLCAPKLILQGLKYIKNTPTLFLLISLYIFYVLGMLYTENSKVGYETIETKLSLLIFPFIFSSYTQTFKNNLNKYLKLFIYGCTVNAILSFVWAAYCFLKPVYVVLYGVSYNLGASYFYYNQLSIFLHPSYIAMYSVFALIALFYLVNTGELKLNWKWYALIVLLVLFILLLSSKAGWISLFLLSLCFFRYLMLKNKIVQTLVIFGVLIGSFSFFNIYFTPSFLARIPKISTITETLKGSDAENKKITTSADGAGSRILVWKAATEIIKNNFWMGVGTGDAKDKMLEKYKEKGMSSEYENKLNSHNQFLNTFIALGVLGFTVLLLCFTVPLYFSYKEKTVLFTAFICLAGINLLVESMLETQAGVIFFAFFYSLLCLQKNANYNPSFDKLRTGSTTHIPTLPHFQGGIKQQTKI